VESPDQLLFDDSSQAQKILDGDQVVCEGDCSESVAAFYMHFQKKSPQGQPLHAVKLCSATLISENKILTNKHCIDEVLKAGDICDEKIFIDIKFPKTKEKPFASYKCKKVLRTSNEFLFQDPKNKKMKKSTSAPDWAVIELTTTVTNRKPVHIETSGVEQDQLPVTLYPVYFDKTFTPTKGVIKEVRCERVFNDGGSQIFANDSDSPLFQIKNCSIPLVHGNSGTGVFYSGTEGQFLLGVMASAESISGTGTVAHCVPDFNAVNAQCIFPDEQEFTEVMKKVAIFKGLYKDTKNAYPLSADIWQAATGARLSDFEQSKMIQKIDIQFNDPWGEPMGYFINKGSSKLAARYEKSLLQLLFPRLPECVDREGSVDLLVFDMPSWNKISEYKWYEATWMSPDGYEGSQIRLEVPNDLQFHLRSIPFIVAQSGKKDFLLKSSGALMPEPLKSLEMQIQKCQ
jgi:hypothetical protein